MIKVIILGILLLATLHSQGMESLPTWEQLRNIVRKYDAEASEAESSFADGTKLICPNDRIPLKYTAAMGIMKCYELRYKEMFNKAFNDYVVGHNVSNGRSFLAADRYARRTERKLSEIIASNLNSTELDAEESYSRIRGFESSVKKYLAKLCLKSSILESGFEIETVIACLDLKVPLICEMQDGRVLLLLGYYKSEQTGICLAAADVAQNKRDEQKPDQGTLRSLHRYPLEIRDKKRKNILRRLENGTSTSISVTATFFSFLVDNSTSMLVLKPNELKDAHLTIITAPEIDKDEIAGLFSLIPF